MVLQAKQWDGLFYMAKTLLIAGSVKWGRLISAFSVYESSNCMEYQKEI